MEDKLLTPSGFYQIIYHFRDYESSFMWSSGLLIYFYLTTINHDQINGRLFDTRFTGEDDGHFRGMRDTLFIWGRIIWLEHLLNLP